jgi:hypothetical protein
VKRLLFAIVLLGIGCHEEPPIVIKFEPADAGKAAAVPVAVGDAAAPVAVARPDAGAAPKAESAGAKKGAPECKLAADCEVVPTECCDCANGGKQEAASHQKAAELKAGRPKRCKDVMCTMMVSTDPSCGKRADCVEGRCVMVEKKSEKKK